MLTRRNFLQVTGATGAAILLDAICASASGAQPAGRVEVAAHIWAYASKYPPNWDCTPILADAFADLKFAGFDKIELMESVLKHDGAVNRIKQLVDKHQLPVAGTSYYGDMWDKRQQRKILEEIDLVTDRLQAVAGNMIGLTVGDAKQTKTEAELDIQAETLVQVMAICKRKMIQPNLHNHTFEVENNLHDLRGTLKRLPDIKLGPDLNWLVRGGVDPVWFIQTYGRQMVFMHIRDQQADGKWTESVGEGIIDFPAIASALKMINYTGAAAVELAFDNPPRRPLRENWQLSRQYVRKTFNW
jgi:sugar phosphate isomerase/epimerase